MNTTRADLQQRQAQFVEELVGTLPKAPDGADAHFGNTIKRRLGTVLDELGLLRRSEARLRELQDALAMLGVNVDPPLTERALGSGDWVRFSYGSFAPVPVTFHLERHLETFVTNLIERHIPPFESLCRPRRQYRPVGSNCRVDLLCRDVVAGRAAGYVVIEFKRGRADELVIGQVKRYLEALRADPTCQGQAVRAIVISESASPAAMEQLERWAPGERIEWRCYEMSFPVVAAAA